MPAIRACPLPDAALLQRYRAAGAYTDCYSAEVEGEVPLARFVRAFYASAVFRPERWLLSALLGFGAGAAEVAALAAGEADRFSAWTVEDRAADQLLLCDYQRRTRSWLMVGPGALPGTTRLYFGSAITVVDRTRAGRLAAGAVFKALLWFHRAYSRALLWGAVRGVARLSADAP